MIEGAAIAFHTHAPEKQKQRQQVKEAKPQP